MKALIVLVLILGVGAGGVLLLHAYRKRSLATRALQSGLAAYGARQYSQAAADLGRYLTVDHDNIELLLKYGDAQMQRRPQTEGSLRQAVAAYETVLRLRRGHPRACEVLIQYYLLARAPVEAERVARAWSEADPQNPRPREKLAASLILQDRVPEAIQLLETIVAAHPAQMEAVNSLVLLRMRQESRGLREAAALVDQAVAARPDSPEARIARARFHLATRWNGQAAAGTAPSGPRPAEPAWYRQVREDLSAAEKASPEIQTTRLDLGRLLLQIGEMERARTQFNRAEELGRDEPAVYLAIGQVALDQGDTAWGVSFMERALEAPLGERRLDVLPVAAELFLGAGRRDDARKLLEELRRAGADSAVLLYLGALVRMADGQVGDAVDQLDDAVRLAPRHARARLALARACVRAGELKRAAAAFQEYLRLSGPGATRARLELAGVYAALERWDDAARAAADAQRESPFDVLSTLTILQIQGYIARPKGTRPDPAAIEKLYQQAENLCKLVPLDVRAQVVLARLAAWRGRIETAADILHRAGQRPDSHPVATAALIDLYAEAGDYPHAIAECQAALKAAGDADRPSLQARLAQLFLAQGDVENAARVIQELAALPPGPARSAVLLDLARFLVKRNELEQARSVLLQIVSADPRDVSSRVMLLTLPPAAAPGPSRQELVNQLKEIEGNEGRQWRLWQARVWLDQEDWAANRPRIEVLLKECLARDAGWEEALAAQAALHEKAGEFNEAADLYRRALDIDPRDPVAARRLLGVAFRTRQWKDVARALDVLPADDPTLGPYRVALALQQGDQAQAEQLLKNQVEADKADFRARLQLVLLMRATGNAARAERWLDEAAAVAPDAPEVLAARVDYYQSRSDWDRALELCNRALARGPDAQAFFLRAGVQEAKGLIQEAQADLRQVLPDKAWTERGFLALGQLYLRHRQIDKALECLSEGLAAVPKSPAIRRAMASILLAGSDTQQEAGTRLLEDLLTEKPGDEQVMLLQADRLTRSDPAQAQRAYDEIIRLHPASVEAFRRSARIAAGEGRPDRAMELVDRGLRVDPRNFALLVIRSELLASEDPARAALAARDAVAVARSALNSQPNDEAAAVALARALALAGSPADGAAELEGFLSRHSSTVGIDTRLALARMHMASGALDKADPLIRQAAELAPSDPAPVRVRLEWLAARQEWDQMAATAQAFARDHRQDLSVVSQAASQLMASGDARRIEKATTLLEQAVQDRADPPVLLAQLGLAYHAAGRTADARSIFEKALKQQPHNVGVINNLAWILCEDLHDPQAAEQLARDAIRTGADDPAYPNLLDTWGVIQYRLGQTGESRTPLEESQKRLEECLRDRRTSPPTRASATFHLARTKALLDRAGGRRLLEELTADPARMNLLSPRDREEAAQRLRELTAPQQPRESSSR